VDIIRKGLKNIEKKTKYLIITLCCIIGIALGTTTAWYTWTSGENTDVTFTIGGITINYNAGVNIDKNLRPTSDKNGSYAVQKEIKVSSPEKITYLNLYLDIITLPEILRQESFKWEVYEGEVLLSKGNFGGVEENEEIKILKEYEVGEEEKVIMLYIWINGVDYDNPYEMGNQEYEFVLRADASDRTPYKDSSGANRPELMEGMVPVEYLTTVEDEVTEDGWYVAGEYTEWYNYENRKWANAVLVTEESELRTASAGTFVSEDDVLAYYVWIPRYSYQLFNAEKTIDVDSYDAQTKGININFENGTATTGTVKCTISSIGEETCTNADNGNWYTHPAFWWDSNDNGVRENSEELTGIWVGKFEISSSTPDAEYGGGSTTSLSVRIKPDVCSWRNNNISNFFTVIQNMMNEDNEYGINKYQTDSHMLKNMEWGAVTYLTNSIYGRCSSEGCEEVDSNKTGSSSDHKVITGEGEYESNVGQSTTGNLTGIYDMSGGAHEYVMGNMIYDDKTMMSGFSDSYNSGFNGILYSSANFTSKTNGGSYPAKRYYDVYSYGSSSEIDLERGHLGDATVEIAIDTERDVGYVWGYNIASFVYESNPWFGRGGCTFHGGIFISSSWYGASADTYAVRSALVSAS